MDTKNSSVRFRLPELHRWQHTDMNWHSPVYAPEVVANDDVEDLGPQGFGIARRHKLSCEFRVLFDCVDAQLDQMMGNAERQILEKLFAPIRPDLHQAMSASAAGDREQAMQCLGRILDVVNGK